MLAYSLISACYRSNNSPSIDRPHRRFESSLIFSFKHKTSWTRGSELEVTIFYLLERDNARALVTCVTPCRQNKLDLEQLGVRFGFQVLN